MTPPNRPVPARTAIANANARHRLAALALALVCAFSLSGCAGPLEAASPREPEGATTSVRRRRPDPERCVETPVVVEEPLACG